MAKTRAGGKCRKCGRAISSGEFCDSCFNSIMLSRIKKSIRETGLLRKNEKILVLDSLSMSILDKIHMPLRIVFADYTGFAKSVEDLRKNQKLIAYSEKIKADKVMIPLTADNSIDDYFLGLFSGKEDETKNGKKDERKNRIPKKDHGIKSQAKAEIISLFAKETREDIKRLAEISKIKKREIKDLFSNKKSPLDLFEKKHPGTKKSIISYIKRAQKIINTRNNNSNN